MCHVIFSLDQYIAITVSFNKYLLSTHNEPDGILGAWGRVVAQNKM